jgi:hypothetical protein
MNPGAIKQGADVNMTERKRQSLTEQTVMRAESLTFKAIGMIARGKKRSRCADITYVIDSRRRSLHAVWGCNTDRPRYDLIMMPGRILIWRELVGQDASTEADRSRCIEHV